MPLERPPAAASRISPAEPPRWPYLADPLAVLEVIDRLDVGPPAVSAKGLSMPYRVFRGARQDVRELTVSYGEKVFDPEAEADRNLAAIIGAQVALNYGLFCRRIRFLGPFDEHDQRFLRVTLAKMAREIYVDKLLEPNPSLDDPWRGLPAVLRSDYVRAEVSFRDDNPSRSDQVGGDVALLPERWKIDRGRFAVLCGGETASLLSHGLLTELGHESHPIFVDTQGKRNPRWRAYPFFRREVPQTARIRTNAEALQSWMCEHLAFVRPGTFEIWKGAASIFASLPILRRRQVGRLVSHGLHDDTCRLRYHGIPYYDGRYELSRHFDHALSRFFRNKGFGIRPASFLRPLSELLAEKVLSERYPDLARIQSACRGPVLRRDDVMPCGSCEPCRRTVAMLLAFDADPALRGFDRSRQESTLAELARTGMRQERAGVELVAHLLHERGWIDAPRLGYVDGCPRPEILHLRFDADRSLLEEIPVQLRRPLLEILLEHSNGMMRRVGSGWQEIYDDEDPDPALYFEHHRTA